MNWLLTSEDKKMNGISLAMSKSCCPMSNICTSNKIKYGTTRDKIDLISFPCRLSNLHFQRISTCVSVPTTHVLKHCVYAGTVDVMGSRSEVPKVSGAVVWFVLLGVGIIAMAFGKTLGTLKANAYCYVVLGCTAVSVAIEFLALYIHGFLVLHGKPYSVGEIIEVGCLKGQVTEAGLITTTVLTAENQREVVLPTRWVGGQIIKNRSRGTIRIPTAYIFEKGVGSISRLSYHPMVYKIPVEVDEIGDIYKITVEITDMMKSNSNVYLEEGRPECCVSEVKTDYVEITIQCNLKKMSKDKLYLAKQDVLLQSAWIIMKHGAALSLENWDVSKSQITFEDWEASKTQIS